MDTSPGEVTCLLERWSQGDRRALDQLTPLVYAELHKIASSYLRRESRQATLQPTALIHEAWMRMVDQSVQFNSRVHFYGIASRLMRQVLVDLARRRGAQRRGGGAPVVPLDGEVVYSDDNAGWILRFDAALEKLGEMDGRKARAVELRHFAGLSLEETSEALGVSLATTKRDLLMAETWIKQEIAR